MASPRRPLNPPAKPEPSAKFVVCSLAGCTNRARHWLRVADHKFAPICHPCHVSLPAELRSSRP